MGKSHLTLVAPTTEIRTVRPTRRPNDELRSREHLTETEVERLVQATKRNRWGHRDSTMILTAWRHGLRVSELVDLRWGQIDFVTATLHVRRIKRGTPTTHPIMGDELRALRRLQREQEPKSPFVFTSERAAPFSTAGFARMMERAGVEAGLLLKCHPHMLRRACGFALGQQGSRHASLAGLPWTSEYPAHGEVHGDIPYKVQGFLEGLGPRATLTYWPTKIKRGP
jgi:integrase